MPGYPLGQYTDDTLLTLATIRAICRTRSVDGAEMAREFVRLWETREIVGAGSSTTEAVYNMMHRGMRWDKAGTPEGRAGNGTAMRASPIGLWDHAHPEDIERDARTASVITHKDSRSIAGAITVATAVRMCLNSSEFSPGEFLEDIAKTVRETSGLFAEAIEDLIGWIPLDPAEALPLIYASGEPEMGPARPGWVTPYVIPTVLCAFYFFLRNRRNYTDAVVGAINAGGDTDTVAAIAGAISGALNGIGAIPRGLVGQLKDSAGIISLIERFYEAAASRS
jgi:ADP-ribosylglycohydrolase